MPHVLVVLEHRGVQRDLVAHHRHHRHGLGAGGDHHVVVAGADAVGGERDGLHARGAEAVDGHRRHGVGQARRAARRCAPRSCPARPRASRSRRSRRRCRAGRAPAPARSRPSARARACRRAARCGTCRAAPCRRGCGSRRRCRRPGFAWSFHSPLPSRYARKRACDLVTWGKTIPTPALPLKGRE